MKNIFQILVLCLVLLCTSCVKDLDFSQAEDLDLRPKVLVSLINSEYTANTFVENATENQNLVQKSEFNLLEREIAKTNLREIKIRVEIDNEFNRNFKIKYKMLDADGNVCYNKFDEMKITANTKGNVFNYRVKIVDNQSFMKSKFVEATIEMTPSGDGSILDPNDKKKLVFKSEATLYLSI